ncbi:hypothetical protein B1757_02870 [Acidithiobacillus marinus]|uniref:Uncharacterized protein n=1 Tax=Acidithiobacillus marinus TaxID=187490 RepID=A0A2I1DPG1_9PROT|nr:hypothetical protein [Acidithiobacillus marinus]PKY11750.1 hypothetical protein B1757_02870 [Acidithiobacillus marinus]
MGIRVRIGSKQDDCRSVYGILYDDSAPDSSNAASFWCGILNGPANIKAHTKNEVFARYQSRVLYPGAEYKEVQHLRLTPKDAFTHGCLTLAKAITKKLLKARTSMSGPDEPIKDMPNYMLNLGKVVVLPLGIGFWEGDRSGLQPEPTEVVQTQIQKIPASQPWMF